MDSQATGIRGGWIPKPRTCCSPGALGLNTAVVDVVLEPRAGGGTLATVHTAAKEGLIPQRPAAKAADALLDSYGIATASPG
jgi:hypothetical protein